MIVFAATNGSEVHIVPSAIESIRAVDSKTTRIQLSSTDVTVQAPIAEVLAKYEAAIAPKRKSSSEPES